MKANSWEVDLLKHYFQNADVANVGDATGIRGSTTAGSLYLSLHTAYPGEAGSQTTSEAAYTSYARKAVARNGTEWTQSTNQITNANAQSFVAATGGNETEYFLGIGRSSSGAGTLDYICPLGTLLGEGTATVADTITIPGLSGLSVDDRIAFFALVTDALPAGITAGTVYWTKTVSSNDITISTTQGGAALDITAAGGVIAYKMTGLAVSNGITPQVGAGALIVKEE
jgi:hypothetical protein